MSLSQAHSPHMSMSQSYGSSLALAAYVAEVEVHKQKYPTDSIDSDEQTPLTSSSDEGALSSKEGKVVKPRLNATLLTTITVVTIGSSLQFGYGTGMVDRNKTIQMPFAFMWVNTRSSCVTYV